jgi:hypothetical protein
MICSNATYLMKFSPISSTSKSCCKLPWFHFFKVFKDLLMILRPPKGLEVVPSGKCWVQCTIFSYYDLCIDLHSIKVSLNLLAWVVSLRRWWGIINQFIGSNPSSWKQNSSWKHDLNPLVMLAFWASHTCNWHLAPGSNLKSHTTCFPKAQCV